MTTDYTASGSTTTQDAPLSSSKSSGAYDGTARAPPGEAAPAAPSRGRQTFKFKVRFDSQKLLFDTRYPEELSPVLPQEEWDGILRHLNTDLNQSAQASIADLHSWTTAMLASCALIVGVFIVPVVWVKTAKHERLMQVFWHDLREFFTEINRRTFIRRGLEWKIVEDRRRMRRRDCYNPLYLYRVELVWRRNVIKSKRELARLGASQPSSATRSAARRSRPPSNIESVQEVPPDRETTEEVDAGPVLVDSEAIGEPAQADSEAIGATEATEAVGAPQPDAVEPDITPPHPDAGNVLLLSDSE